jgi:hypothetical protein
MYYNTELYHHGILGQKWGVRRYQNDDGTLTQAGHQRYHNDDGESKKKELTNTHSKLVTAGKIATASALVAIGAYAFTKTNASADLSDSIMNLLGPGTLLNEIDELALSDNYNVKTQEKIDKIQKKIDTRNKINSIQRKILNPRNVGIYSDFF